MCIVPCVSEFGVSFHVVSHSQSVSVLRYLIVSYQSLAIVVGARTNADRVIAVACFNYLLYRLMMSHFVV